MSAKRMSVIVKIAMLPLCAALAGCANKNKPQSAAAAGANGTVLEVGAAGPHSAMATSDDNYAAPAPYAGKLSGYQPAAAATAPEPTIIQTPAPQAASERYTVRKGDTLFRIAREHYGDGKQWQRIASANPGLTPGSLKAGQVISVP